MNIGDTVKVIANFDSPDQETIKQATVARLCGLNNVDKIASIDLNDRMGIIPTDLLQVVEKKEDRLKHNNAGSKETVSVTGSKRLNSGKPEVSQLDPIFVLELAELMTISAEKYGKYNWALGQNYTTAFDSCMRHLLQFMAGEDRDKESSRNHLIYAAANIMILWTSYKKGSTKLDDRFFK